MSPATGEHRPDGGPDLNALAAWADGRLDPDERAGIAAHLATCARCRAIVAELARGAAPPAAVSRPALAIAATIAIAALGGGIYFIAQRPGAPAETIPATTAPAPAAPQPTPNVSPSPAAPAPSSPAVRSAPPDRTRAAGTTAVHGRTFHLIAGEWVDDAYRESDFLPAVNVASRDQLDAIPALRPYATLGSRFTVVLGGTVYRVSIP